MLYLSIYLSVCLSIYLPIYLSIYLFIYMIIYIYMRIHVKDICIYIYVVPFPDLPVFLFVLILFSKSPKVSSRSSEAWLFEGNMCTPPG